MLGFSGKNVISSWALVEARGEEDSHRGWLQPHSQTEGGVCVCLLLLFTPLLFAAQSMGLCFIGKRDFAHFISEVKARSGVAITTIFTFINIAVPRRKTGEVCVSLGRRTRPPQR